MNPVSLEHDNIIGTLPFGIVAINSNLKITYINQTAEQICAITRRDVLSKACSNICKSNFCSSECPVKIVLQTNQPLHQFRSDFCAANHSTQKVLLDTSFLADDRPPYNAVVIAFRPEQCIQQSQPKEAAEGAYGIIGVSPEMQSIYELIAEIKDADVSVLIQGETGTGKELICDAIQKLSLRRDKPFVKVNCSVFPEQLLASELFGHAKGAFTGARQDRIGRFETADTGTIFLDEIAEMPISMQSQLLRVLQDGSFERLGESRTRYADVRIIAATNKRLDKAIENGTFRRDLYFRLNVVPIQIPPLRERKIDLPHLVNHFIHKFNTSPGGRKRIIDEDALNILLNHHWPGNVRELENVVEYALIRSQKNKSICASGLPVYLRPKDECTYTMRNKTVKQIKAEQFIHLLQQNNWNQSRVAELLGINRTTVWRRMRALGLTQHTE